MSTNFNSAPENRYLRKVAHKAWQRARGFVPVQGFAFDRPLVVLQSDDWGRVGLRDREGWEEVRTLVPNLGERAYDFYSLETAEDVAGIASLLQRHRDSAGRTACLGMNFVVANVDFAQVAADEFRRIHLRPLSAGLPDGWNRPGLFEQYRHGVAAGVFSPGLHGTTHFCHAAVERFLTDPGERGALLRGFWKAGVPYIHWRMPWIGFEYWAPERSEKERFLSAELQEELIQFAADHFTQFFNSVPRSACAPGYRADDATHRAWERSGIRVAQNGPGSGMPPHLDGHGILQLYRTMDFEPAVAGAQFSLADCVKLAEDCFARGVPAVISVHSINFHSSIRNFRDRTLELLDEFLAVLESRHRDLLFVRDEDVVDLVDTGKLQSGDRVVTTNVTERRFDVRPAVGPRG